MERANDMASLFKQGRTLQEIANVYGITREYVRQILKKEGITGKDGGAALRPKKREQICKAEKCDRLANGAQGYCTKHYERILIYGTSTPVFKRKFLEHEEFCLVEGCNRKFKSNGYCNTHYCRWRRTGSPGDAEILPQGKHKNRGTRSRQKLSDSQITEIRSLYVRGESFKASEFSLSALARKYGVSDSHISRIVNKKNKESEVSKC